MFVCLCRARVCQSPPCDVTLLRAGLHLQEACEESDVGLCAQETMGGRSVGRAERGFIMCHTFPVII